MSSETSLLGNCALCGLDIKGSALYEENLVFCCAGCQAVYRILSAKNALAEFDRHPLFKQAVNAGLISNPALLESLRQKSMQEGVEVEKLYLEVLGMWCPSCAELIRLVLMQERGVKSCVVDYATDLAGIEFYPRFIGKEALIKAIAGLGYRPQPLQGPERRAVSFDLYLRFIVAAFFSLNIMMMTYPVYASFFEADEEGMGTLFAWCSFWASVPVVAYSGWPILRRCWNTLKVGIPGMELLVVLGVLSSFGVSVYELFSGTNRVYFDSMTVIIAFVLLGKIIEAKAKFSAKDSILRLSMALPKRGRKRINGNEARFVPIKEIQAGDVVIALTGEKIVLDGVVVEGEGACDESLMTGESVPVCKAMDSKVVGGSIVQNGWLAFRVLAAAESSVLRLLIDTVAQEMTNKAAAAPIMDRIARGFVPLVLMIALGAGIYSWTSGGGEPWLRGISVLLISCPCAIGIAAPLAEAQLMNEMAKIGAIVRNRNCLAALGRETLFVFDKTGTVTEGKFKVLKGLELLDGYQRSALKSLAVKSNHPVSIAISHALEEMPLAFEFEKVEEIAGKGIRGKKEGVEFVLGSAAFLNEQNIFFQESEDSGMETRVYYGSDSKLLACIRLGDKIRREVPEVIQSLRPSESVLLSGDAPNVAASVAKACGFAKWHGGESALQKKEKIEAWKREGKIVGMVGDGINDVAALAAADVGYSVVSAADFSIQVSDVLLTTDRLDVLNKVQKLAKKGRRILHQNLFWAFFYNLIGLGLAAAGLLSPLFAAFAMVASSLMVLFNARRLKE